MAEFIWKNGNGGKWDVHRVEKFLLHSTKDISNGRTIVTMKYDEETFGPSEGAPSTIKLTVKNLKLNNSDELKDGKLLKIEAFDGGKSIFVSKGLKFDIGEAFDDHGSVQGWQIFNGGHKFIGSDNSKAPDDWNGDAMTGGFGDDVIKGNKGDDFISGTRGSDKVDGGKGNDVVDYYFYDQDGPGLTVNMTKGTVKNGEGMVDKLTSIERVYGTSKKDVFKGADGKEEQFVGYQGKDIIDGGKGGGDRARYDRDERRGGTDGIEANLKDGKIVDGFGDTDRVTGIEEVRGTDFGDVFIGNSADNGFEGRDGDDKFVFGKGNDWAQGGEGADTFIFKGKFKYDWIGDFNSSEGDKIKIANANKFSDLEIIENDDGDAVIRFDGNAVELDGLSMDDISASDFIF